jgi:hypothetical protein
MCKKIYIPFIVQGHLSFKNRTGRLRYTKAGLVFLPFTYKGRHDHLCHDEDWQHKASFANHPSQSLWNKYMLKLPMKENQLSSMSLSRMGKGGLIKALIDRDY